MCSKKHKRLFPFNQRYVHIHLHLNILDAAITKASPLLCFQARHLQATGANMADPILFEDIFNVGQLDPDGKKFEKVSRIEAHSEQFDMFIHLDVNTEIYPMAKGDRFTMALAHTLNLDGTPDTGYYTQGGRRSLADKYEYVMHGKLYKLSTESKGPSAKAEIYVSHGGLLMMLRGDPSYISKFELDQRLFLLIRKL